MNTKMFGNDSWFRKGIGNDMGQQRHAGTGARPQIQREANSIFVAKYIDRRPTCYRNFHSQVEKRL